MLAPSALADATPPPQSLSAFEWPVHVYIFAFWIREEVNLRPEFLALALPLALPVKRPLTLTRSRIPRVLLPLQPYSSWRFRVEGSGFRVQGFGVERDVGLY